ncbi:MAG: recombinase family protein [Rhodospirillaceae bacterium]|nr:MAG: recombinase family protein [Rhodospirillaceae bacterium]
MHKTKNRKTTAGKVSTRCAIYTRKSHEEGLEQEFNSLDAQRESCEAYIASQKHEGWTCLPEMYDDGGISGATMERPALKRLLADIETGKVDTVVVYKVDRLTRSLSDFAKIVEVFDTHGVSFVSVTQAFNTTTSMGRLTLNMLLSFAQFEREVTGERIRDKIAASKKKGMWMGGLPPLGYDVKDRKLVVNEAEAETVRTIYRRYVALGSVPALKEELDRDGIASKARSNRFGRQTGGKPLARGALYHMLQNPIYLGRIVHKETSYPGEHKAIIDEALLNKVQQKLAANRIDRANGVDAAQPSLLAGLLYDDAGEPMTPSHANKKGTRYRYYVSKALVRGNRRRAPRGRRVPAGDLEELVEGRLRQFLASETKVFDAIAAMVADVSERAAVVARVTNLAEQWPKMKPSERRRILTVFVDRIDLLRETLEIHIMPGRLITILGDQNDPQDWTRPETNAAPTITFTVPARIKRTGMETRLLIDGDDGNVRRKPDRSLCRVLAQAHQYHGMLMRKGGKTIAELAAEVGITGSYFTRILRLSFLAPDVVKAILHDRHPIELTAKRLANEVRLPIAWEEQRTRLGIG